MSDGDVVLIHGHDGSGPEHWQSWLARELGATGRRVSFPQLPDNTAPDLERWLHILTPALTDTSAPAGQDVLAHSLGCWLWVHAARRGLANSRSRVLLVAPPSPSWVAATLPAFPALTWADLAAMATANAVEVVIGEGDDLLSPDDVATLTRLVPSTRTVPGGGHLHTAAGFGPWPAALAWASNDRTVLHDQTTPVTLPGGGTADPATLTSYRGSYERLDVPLADPTSTAPTDDTA